MWEIYISVTGNCNLGCRYCYEKNTTPHGKLPIDPCSYSIDDVLRLLGEVAKNRDTVSLVFFGGEPTLRPDLLRDWSAAVAAAYPAVHQVLHTNGLLMDTVAERFYPDLESIILSVNMESRITLGSRDFYLNTVRRNVEWVKGIADVPVILRLTYTEQSNFLATCFLLEDVVDAIHWQIAAISGSDLENALRNYSTDMSLLTGKWFSQLRTGSKGPAFVPLDYAFLVASDPSTFDASVPPCGYGNTLLFVDVDGTMYACPEMKVCGETKIGHIRTGFGFDNVRRDFLHKLDACKDCPARYYCRGRCPGMHLRLAAEPLHAICDMTRKQLGDFVAQMNLLTPSEKTRHLSRLRTQRLQRLMALLECVP